MNKKVAIVTGSSQGIGREIALNLARSGYDLIITGLKIQKLESVKSEIINFGSDCLVVSGDITSQKFIHSMINQTIERFGRIDILVNNAGMIKRTSTLDTTLADWEQVLKVNLTGSFMTCKEVLPVMVKQSSGNIVNITSASSVTPHPNAAPSYGASKAALTYLTKHLAQEFASNHIRVNAVQCGPIESDMTRQWSSDYREKMFEKIPLHHLGKVSDVAAAVSFLVSDDAKFITGTSLNLSGGKLMY